MGICEINVTHHQLQTEEMLPPTYILNTREVFNYVKVMLQYIK